MKMAFRCEIHYVLIRSKLHSKGYSYCKTAVFLCKMTEYGLSDIFVDL